MLRLAAIAAALVVVSAAFTFRLFGDGQCRAPLIGEGPLGEDTCINAPFDNLGHGYTAMCSPSPRFHFCEDQDCAACTSIPFSNGRCIGASALASAPLPSGVGSFIASCE